METNPEYKVIVLANKLLVDIDNEIIVIHKVCFLSPFPFPSTLLRMVLIKK